MKQYNGEKAIISLTSWKARINTVDKTIFSIIKHCPGFHIVLVLSEEEFPNKENELPNNLMLLINNNMIELLWVYKNYKSFKKLLPTMAKYPNVPIIIADDGNVYLVNFAENLYKRWLKNKDTIFCNEAFSKYGFSWGVGGCGIIFPPNCYNEEGLKLLDINAIIASNHDDAVYGILAKKLNIPFKHNNFCPWKFNKEIFIEIEKETALWKYRAYNDKNIPQLKKIIYL
jgi:hypothetical protein